MKFVVEVSNVQAINSPTLRGRFDLQYGGIKILGMLAFAKDGKRWVSFPSQVHEDEGGKHYTPILKAATRDSWDRLQEFCKADPAIKALLADSAAPEPAQPNEEDLPF